MSRHSAKGRPWDRTRRQVLAESGGNCEIRTPGICTGRATQVDHIVPRSRGGTDARWNLRSCCQQCNLARNRTVPAVDNGWTW
jgi:5-methylcytosine-specific restriction protein A